MRGARADQGSLAHGWAHAFLRLPEGRVHAPGAAREGGEHAGAEGGVSALAAIVARHVEACCKELRAAVEAEMREAIAGLAPGVPVKARRLPQERANPKRRVKSATSGDRRGKSKPAATATRTCGCGPVGRHRKECALAKPPQPVERSPRVAKAGTGTDSPRMAMPVDETRAQRFAKLEERVKARTGAAA
jgi:hypothetical protein